ncbi:hypothetical protein B0H67DRAFT_591448 [Lasiosphaeris hirsuta]|uniref:Secreted protein n=1 Tax=Lasiosphaeris hirsuta TaxID=260670 RepID=A0AA40DKA9_9PEZI|nr:hypothetical protein B0H67DRAFT_591448 [Lasiosphaeris hirsuta]
MIPRWGMQPSSWWLVAGGWWLGAGRDWGLKTAWELGRQATIMCPTRRRQYRFPNPVWTRHAVFVRRSRFAASASSASSASSGANCAGRLACRG